jgi:hypothetical protein
LTVVTGPSYIVDVVELASREEHLPELAWHIDAAGQVETKADGGG